MRRKRSASGRAARGLCVALVLVALAAAINVAVYSVVPPVGTAMMRVRALEGEWPSLPRWVPLESISPALQRAVLAAEDQRFCQHWGVDMRELRRAIEGGGDRGASTITMQTAKNVFLWPGRSYVRKVLEAGYALLIETLWTKEHIFEVYLNVAEWGRGLYGAEAAARTYFGRTAASLTAYQAALMAATLPNPRARSPASPSGYVAGRAAQIRGQMRTIPVAGDFGLCP